MTTLPPAVTPKRRWTKIAFAIYAAGFFVCELLLLWGAYMGGGFDRPHTLAGLAITGILYMTVGLLWPVAAIVVILYLPGIRDVW